MVYGFEPTRARVSPIFLAEVEGVQPSRRDFTDLAVFKTVYLCQLGTSKFEERVGFEPTDHLPTIFSFQDWSIQPLWHLSKILRCHSPIMILRVANSRDRIRTCIYLDLSVGFEPNIFIRYASLVSKTRPIREDIKTKNLEPIKSIRGFNYFLYSFRAIL